MRITEILDKIKRALDLKKYDLGCDKSVPWVDLYTDPLHLGELNDLSRMLADRLGMDSSRFHIWSRKEDEIGIGFILPYLRVLKKDEIRAKYVYIESEFRSLEVYFPPTGKEFVLMSGEKRYDGSCDVNNRIFLTERYDDISAVEEGNMISIWCASGIIAQKEYLLTLIEDL